MPDSLQFMMGEYPAIVPGDRSYFRTHMWSQREETTGVTRIGLTSYAVRLLQDVYFLDWTIDPETSIRLKQEIGEIESSKAISTIYAPADGLLRDFNPALMQDPSLINGDNYDRGWLFTFETNAATLTAEEYVAHLAANWDETQRLLKGQYNA